MAAGFAATALDLARPLPRRARGPLVGQRVDHFELQTVLGEGGMGVVYLAHDLALNRIVAVKLLRPELGPQRALAQRLVDEARAQARLTHPHVITIFHIGEWRSAPYFAMELVRGRTLAQRLAQDGPLPWPDALECLIQAARGLLAADDHGLVHRDIKPSNLLLVEGDGDGSRWLPTQVKIADFGLAVPAGQHEGKFVGSPFYAAPEQIHGREPSRLGDIYSLGITAFELITGAPPFRAEELGDLLALHSVAERPEIPANRAPWRLRRLISAMMSPDAAARPPTYEALLARLEACRPTAVTAGGLVARAAAFVIDAVLTVGAVLAVVTVAGLGDLRGRTIAELAALLLILYQTASQRLVGTTLGKHLLGLRLRGTDRPLATPRLLLRTALAAWMPALAAVAAPYPLAAEAPLPASLWILGAMAVPWLCGILIASRDECRQTLHDRVARTRVVYDLPDRGAARLLRR
jgi:serine/threonine-protein kinase